VLSGCSASFNGKILIYCKMTNKYKLTYFNCHGRGECVRMLFALAGVEYEDHRIQWASDAWKEFKPKTPFGILPILEVDGKVFCQSVAIARYLGNKFGFTGKTDLDKLQADMIVDCIVDLCNPLETIYEEQDETKKQEILNAYIPKLDKHLENLEKMLEGGNGFFIGDSITWVDCVWTGLLYYLYFMKFGPIIEKHPKVAAIKGRVESEPRIAEWIRKRPHAEF